MSGCLPNKQLKLRIGRDIFAKMFATARRLSPSATLGEIVNEKTTIYIFNDCVWRSIGA